jgi:hypothetical protein
MRLVIGGPGGKGAGGTSGVWNRMYKMVPKNTTKEIMKNKIAPVAIY